MTAGDFMMFPFSRRSTFGRDSRKNLSALESSLPGLSASSVQRGHGDRSTSGDNDNDKDKDDDDDDNEDDDDEADGQEEAIRRGPLGLNQLNSPTEPLVELVFVHGLGGGSRKSWSKTKLEDHFWPRSWLPRDPGFHNARVHSFGYKSAKVEIVETIAGIPDISQSLLTALRDSPVLRHNHNPIVLIGHSMGGLVIKKALIQAHLMDAYKHIAARIRSLYFLGTPHRGSDFTTKFQRLFKKLPLIQTTESIGDLDPTSRLLESLNNDFPRVAPHVEIRTFWENKESALLGGHQYVVPKHSACLSYTNEVSDGLDADHRGICKYDKPTSANYIKVWNALSATVEDIVREYSTHNQAILLETLAALRDYLGVYEPPEDDLADREGPCLSEDTCSWFTSSQSYRTWRDSHKSGINLEAANSNLILIEAEPGAGKSVLAAQIINNLQDLNYECSYYFLDAQDRQKSRLSYLLRSIAFQMALINPSVRQSVLELREQNAVIDKEDDKYIHIWRKLFVGCILKRHPDKQHYWVIDGLDESQQGTNLLQMFLKIDSSVPVNILLTSRPEEGIRRAITSYENKATYVRISKTDTLTSVSDYVEARSRHLGLRNEDDRLKLVRSILDNADGSFLWVKLVLDNMNTAWGPEKLTNYLKHIPKGMNNLYKGILTALERQIPEDEKPRAKAVLNWTMCANPPLTVEELEAAVKLDTGMEIYANKICEMLRNLICIDHGNKVRPIHQTVRSYLLETNLDSNFALSSTDAHQRIANVPIKHLHQYLRNLRNPTQLRHWHQTKIGFDDYALLYFSDHIRRAPTNDHTLFLESEKFLTNYGMSWIACIAFTGSLKPLIKTSQNLRHWLQARIKSTPPLGELARKTTRMQQWTVDLVRLVAKFGRHLLESPGAIYTLVPPFVPKESVLSIPKPRPRDIVVNGLDNRTWDDRLCSMFYQATTCTAIATGKFNFAVGLKNGDIHVYDNNTLQILKTVQHGAVVKLLKYNEAGSMLLSSGFRKTRMWIIPDGTQMWEVAVREPRLAAEFVENDHMLISISSRHKLIKQDAMTGIAANINERRSSAASGGPEESRIFRRELQYAEFSADAEMLATMQRERPIQLTDIEDRYDVGVVELEMSDDGEYGTSEQPITAMTFCANTDIALLAVAYRDGILASFDRDLRILAKRGDNKGATLLAGSPDGLILAAANVEGVITLYDFEELAPLHVLYTSSIENIRSIAFSGDGHRLIDIRDRQANIWAPSALISRPRDDADSLSESTLAPTVAASEFNGPADGIVEITAVVPIPRSDHFICGHGDGTVVIYNTRDAKPQKIIYKDPSKQWISRLLWDSDSRVLATVCGTSGVTIHSVSSDWSVERVLMQQVFTHPVTQLFVRETLGVLRVMVIAHRTIHLWTSDGNSNDLHVLTERHCRISESEGYWIDTALSPSDHTLTLVGPTSLRSYGWKDLEEVNPPHKISFHAPTDQARPLIEPLPKESIVTFDRATTLSMGGERMLLLRSVSSQSTTTLSSSTSSSSGPTRRKRWLLNLSYASPDPIANLCIDPSRATTSLLPGSSLPGSLLPISHLIEHVIGIRNEGKHLIFLDKSLWVCSYEIKPWKGAKGPQTDRQVLEYSRHLFIPDDWISSNYTNTNSQLLFVLGGVKQDCLISVKKHEVAVIKQPFSHSEKLYINL